MALNMVWTQRSVASHKKCWLSSSVHKARNIKSKYWGNTQWVSQAVVLRPGTMGTTWGRHETPPKEIAYFVTKRKQGCSGIRSLSLEQVRVGLTGFMCAFSTINILNPTELIQLNLETDLLSCTSVFFVPVLLLVQSVWQLLQRGCWFSNAVQGWFLQRGAAL